MVFVNKMYILEEIALHCIAPVCNPTLQVMGLQLPCMEKAGIAVDALQLFLRLKYININSYIVSLKADIYSVTQGVTFIF